MKVSFVVFDWDGTLADSKGRIVDTLRRTLKGLSYGAQPIERLLEHDPWHRIDAIEQLVDALEPFGCG